MPVNFEKLRELFEEAVEHYPPEDWERFLGEKCGDDMALKQQVAQLLNAHRHGGSALDSPPPDVFATEIRPISEQPGDLIGPYKLLQQIGEGGMGVVYMAEQSEPVERRVALKIIKPGMDSQQVIARFEAERQALAMMDHPNIAKVLDAGTTETGRPYFVMELVKGIPVTKYCDEQHFSPKERLDLFIPICQAVQHAHQKGIIHRDLKPSNILIAQYDNKAVPKIIDFGVAKAVSHRLTEKTMFTQYGQIVGTIEYMSPEQARFNQLDVDTRSDIYSLGVLLYELLTGETPFDKKRLRSAEFDELLRIIREEEPPKPSTKLSGSESLANTAVNRKMEPKKLSLLVRGDLDWIVMKALEKDRARRYETATSFAADIQHYLNDEPVTACPPSAAYKFRKFARRNKAVIGTTAAIAVSLIAGIIATSWQAYLADRERTRAVKAESLAQKRLDIAQEEQRHAQSSEQRAIAMRDFANDRFQLALSQLTGYVELIRSNQDLNRRFNALQRNLLGQAAPFYEKLLESAPEDDAVRSALIDAHLQLGIVHSSIGDHHASINAYRRVLQVADREHVTTPQATDSLSEINLTQSVLHLRSGSPELLPVEQRQYEDILRQLRSRTILADNDRHSEFLCDAEFEYAKWLARSQHWEDCLPHLQAALKLNPEKEATYLLSAAVNLYLGHCDEYVTICQDLRERVGINSNSFGQVACLYPAFSHEDYVQISAFMERESRNEDLQQILRSVAGVYRGVSEYRAGHFDQAIKWLSIYKDSIYGDGHSIRARQFLAMALARTGKIDEARKQLQEADERLEIALSRTRQQKQAGDLGVRWGMWLRIQIVRAEAMQVLSQYEDSAKSTADTLRRERETRLKTGESAPLVAPKTPQATDAKQNVLVAEPVKSANEK